MLIVIAIAVLFCTAFYALDAVLLGGGVTSVGWIFQQCLVRSPSNRDRTAFGGGRSGSGAGLPLSDNWAVFESLEGDPAYEAVQARLIERLNAERAALGLDPVTT